MLTLGETLLVVLLALGHLHPRKVRLKRIAAAVQVSYSIFAQACTYVLLLHQ